MEIVQPRMKNPDHDRTNQNAQMYMKTKLFS